MALTEDQIKELKSQLFSQVKGLPEDKRIAAEKQIQSLTPQALEAMVNQQKERNTDNKGIFRRIVDGDIPSKKVEENKDAIAVLDIRPVSIGHVVIIPKKAIDNSKLLSASTLSLAKKMARRMSDKLKCSNTLIQSEIKFDEVVINVIPIYDKPLTLNSPRYEASEDELAKYQDSLRVIKKPKIQRIKIVKKSPKTNYLKINRKIP